MIKDAKGRKWAMRFKQYRQGWSWEGSWKNLGQGSGMVFFESRAAAMAEAERVIRSHDAVAEAVEYFRRVAKRGAPCQLTAADHAAIARAGLDRHADHDRVLANASKQTR
jgi:hypothetical protein